MNVGCGKKDRQTAEAFLNPFERYLSLWVFLCILAGIGLGRSAPSLFRAIGGAEWFKVNIPVAILVWLMIVPMLLKVNFRALHEVRPHWKGIAVTVFVNWAIKPFSMAVLGAESRAA